jgi:hypothetical protein
MSDILADLSSRLRENTIAVKAESYYDTFSEFCSPVKISIILVAVHFLYLLSKMYQSYKKTGDIRLCQTLTPFLMMLTLLGLTYYFCSSGQPTYGWVILGLYVLTVFLQKSSEAPTLMGQAEDRLLQLFQIKERDIARAADSKPAAIAAVAVVPVPAPSAPAPSALSDSLSGEQPYDPKAGTYMTL